MITKRWEAIEVLSAAAARGICDQSQRTTSSRLSLNETSTRTRVLIQQRTADRRCERRGSELELLFLAYRGLGAASKGYNMDGFPKGGNVVIKLDP